MIGEEYNRNNARQRVIGALFALLTLSFAIVFLTFAFRNIKTIISDCRNIYYCLDYNFINRQTDEDVETRGNRLKVNYQAFANYLLSECSLRNSCKSYMIDVYGLTVKCLGLYKPVPYSAIVRLTNNQLSYYRCDDDDDIDKYAHTLIDFKTYLARQNIAFVYVQAPYKIYKYQPALPQGIVDNNNQLFDRMLNVAGKEVSVIDMREYFMSSPENHYDLFYPGDSHWKLEYAFIAAQQIMKRLHDNYSYVIDPIVNDFDNYELVISDEKRNNISQNVGNFYFSADEEREQFLVPKFKTEITIIEDSDKYQGVYNPHLLYSVKFKKYIKNSNAVNRKKVLFLGDSFSPQVMSCLTLHFSEIEYQALNSYDGNIFEEIEKFNPDLVVLLLTAGIVDMHIPGKPAPNTKRYFEMLVPPKEKDSNQVK